MSFFPKNITGAIVRRTPMPEEGLAL